jgi:two-component system response regulator
MNKRPILLVEDNPDDVTFTMRAFKKNNVSNELVVATDGEKAIALLLPEDGAQALRPALVLLDVKLPKVDGIEVLRRIRADARTRWVPVIMLTTSSEETDMVNAYRLGANSFVRKPVVFADFLHAANVLGVYWLAINQPVPDFPVENRA